jgi:phosphatidylserine/phosphatidylglycerophosphate/cardiolipin synthase-like enzyme
MPDSTSKKDVTITSGQTTIVSFNSVNTKACKVDAAIYYENARSFIEPSQKRALEKVFWSGLTVSPDDGIPLPKPNRFLLILGHADQVGSRASNLGLSKRRALAPLAVFNLDAAAWVELYDKENWGEPEIRSMSEAMAEGADDDVIADYLSNLEERYDLISRYLIFLRPEWLPQESPPFVELMDQPGSSPVIACSTDHPVIDAPNTAKRENRRAEFLYFRDKNPPLNQSPLPGVYRSWQAACSGGNIPVYIYMENEYGEPYIGDFHLTLPHGETLEYETTDAEGRWAQDDLTPGMYTVVVPNALGQGMEITRLPDGKKSYRSFEAYLNPCDNEIRVQVIDLNKWFVPRQNYRSDIPQFSRGNIVEPLIDGAEMLEAVYDAFTGTNTSGHYIYIAVWMLTEGITLLGALTPTSEVLDVITTAIGHGVEVKALLWDQVNHKNSDEIKEINKKYGKYRGEAILDNETLIPGSHHQKAIVVKGPSGLIAFCGGIDLAEKRWDTPNHTVPDTNRDDYPGNPNPWHDVHAKVRGPAAGDIETNFRERWNNHPDSKKDDRTPVESHAVPKPIPEGPHLVQTLRTFPPRKGYPFAPVGELGIFKAYKKAILNARVYIYIEDQYFVNYEIAGTILELLERGFMGKIIVVIPMEPDSFRDAFWFHRRKIINMIKQKYHLNFEVYYLTNRANPEDRKDIYVHAKMMIVDDIWAIISSANINRRSMTHDSEIGVAVIDGTIEKGRRKFARDLRIRLWAEHLMVKKDKVDDPIEGIKLWPKNRGEGKGHVCVYPRPKGIDLKGWNIGIDPDGR